MTHETKCRLCGQEEATVTGSHFVSSCIVESVYGKRGSEDAYQINLQTRTYKNYKGASNLQNTDPNVKDNFIVSNNVFCEACEKLFAILENDCCHPIRINLQELKKGSKKIQRTSQGNKYFTLEKVRKNVFQYFMYSLLWRQILEHQLKEHAIVVDNVHFESIKSELLKLKRLNHQQVRKTELGFKLYDFITLTTYHKLDTTINPIMANPAMTNPHLFFLATLDVLLFTNDHLSANFSKTNFFEESILDNELRFNLNEQIRFGIVNETVWNGIVNNFYERQLQKMSK